MRSVSAMSFAGVVVSCVVQAAIDAKADSSSNSPTARRLMVKVYQRSRQDSPLEVAHGLPIRACGLWIPAAFIAALRSRRCVDSKLAPG